MYTKNIIKPKMYVHQFDNFLKIKEIFFDTTYLVMYEMGQNLQLHSIVLAVKVDNKIYKTYLDDYVYRIIVV